MTQFPLLLAHWTFNPNSTPPAPRPWTTYEYVQWSDTGTIPGIPGRVDMNVFEQQVMATPPAALSAVSLPPIAPPPAAMSPITTNSASTNPLMMSPLITNLPTTNPTATNPTATAAFAGTGGDVMALIQNPTNAMRLDPSMWALTATSGTTGTITMASRGLQRATPPAPNPGAIRAPDSPRSAPPPPGTGKAPTSTSSPPHLMEPSGTGAPSQRRGSHRLGARHQPGGCPHNKRQQRWHP